MSSSPRVICLFSEICRRYRTSIQARTRWIWSLKSTTAAETQMYMRGERTISRYDHCGYIKGFHKRIKGLYWRSGGLLSNKHSTYLLLESTSAWENPGLNSERGLSCFPTSFICLLIHRKTSGRLTSVLCCSKCLGVVSSPFFAIPTVSVQIQQTMSVFVLDWDKLSNSLCPILFESSSFLVNFIYL